MSATMPAPEPRRDLVGERVTQVIGAEPGWWVRYSYGPPGDRSWGREPVAAWGLIPGEGVVALVTADGGWLAPASDQWPERVLLELYGGQSPPRCDCGRRVGDDDDPGWCPACGGEIPERDW